MWYFIVNEKSKSGKRNSIWNHIKKYMDENEAEYDAFFTGYQGHATKIAGDICHNEGNDKKIIVVGGDGTLNEVINGITDFENVSVGVIPNGSGNDFARGMGIERNGIKYLEKIFQAPEEKKIDLGAAYIEDECTPKLFIISAGIGMDALVCKLAMTSRLKKYLNKIRLGKLTYLMLTVKSLFSMKTVAGKIVCDNKEFNVRKMIFCAAMNFRAEGGGVPMTPGAKADDGLLSACCAYGISKWTAFSYLPFLVAAKHEKKKGVKILNSKVIIWELETPMTLHTDGEYCGEVTKVKFECLEKKVKILI